MADNHEKATLANDDREISITTQGGSKEQITQAVQEQDANSEQDVVDFDENDPENPLNWSPIHKWTLVVLISLLVAMSQLATIIAAPVSPQILSSFHTDNTLYRTLIVSIWELGEVLGPLMTGPLSEVYGRWIISNTFNILFSVLFVGAALSTNIHMLIAFRFLTGACTASSAIGPGIVGDLFAPEDRGHAMAFMTLAGAVGPVIGPIIGSYLGQDVGWRWAFWLPLILNGTLSILFFAVYRETYKVTILNRKAERLRRETGNPRIRSKYETHETVTQKLYQAIIRPLYLLTHIPLLILTLYISLVNGYVYLVMTIISPVFQEQYHFSEGASGLAFLGLCIGLTVGSLFSGWLLQVYVKRVQSQVSQLTPEMRLPPVVLGGTVMPLGFFMFGWSAQYHVQWMAPIVGTAIIAFSLAATTVSIRSYIVDCFGIYAVAAMSAMLAPRNAAAAFLPLAAPPLYRELGYGWGNSVLGFIALAFVPVPLLLMKFGARLRERTKVAIME